MVRASSHHLIDIGTERQRLMTAITHPVEFDGDKWRIFDLNTASLGRCLKQEAIVVAAFQDAGEQAHQFLPLNRAAAIQPCAVTFNEERQIAAIDRGATWAIGS